MADSIKLYQGIGKTVTIKHDDAELPNADEIEIYIGRENDVEIIKSLTAGDITGMSSDSYNLTFVGADTESIKSGEYDWHAKITRSDGSTDYGRFGPSTIKIVDTLFSTQK